MRIRNACGARRWLASGGLVFVVSCGSGGATEDDGFTFTPMGTAGTAADSDGSGGTDDGEATGGSTGGTADVDDGEATGDETGSPPPDGEHALGTIVLGETHPVDAPANALAVLAASFVPDASNTAQGCGMDVGGCEIALPPVCMPTCLAGEVCVYDDACVATCEEPCNAACAADEVCYFPFPGTPACRKAETFDAGRLDIFGTISPITLFPPYTLPPGTEGPLAQADKELTLKASGATSAGFAPFEAKVTSTDSVFSTIDEILPAEAFGAGPLMIGWAPGDAEITISLTVTGTLATTGTVTCPADDTAGAFAVPRAAINGAVEGDTPQTISISVQRTHTETTADLQTQGALLSETVQPIGQIDFTYTSIETGTLTNL